MPLVRVFTSCTILERVRRVNVHQKGKRGGRKEEERKRGGRGRERRRGREGGEKGEERSGEARPGKGAVLVLLFVEKS